MKLIVTIAASLLLTACVTATDTETEVAANQSADAIQTADASQDDYASQRVCVREAPTGTRIPARTICRTQAEWDVIRERSQETLREIQRAPTPGDQPG